MIPRAQRFVLAAAAAAAVIPACSSAKSLDEVDSSEDAVTDVDITTCMQPYNAQVPRWKESGVSPGEIRKRLETAFVRCRAPETPAPLAAFVGGVNADFTRAGVALAQNKMAYPAYTAVIADRNRKLTRAHTDASFVAALSSGDADRDLVPDSLDTCADTPDLSATDDSGCPARVAPCPKELGRCDVSGDVQRAIAQIPLWFNKACDDAALPSSVAPLAWGRGHQGALGTDGFNILVSRVENQPAGCDVFYEVEFRFTDGPTTSPPVLYANAIFSEKEVINNDPKTLMFPLKYPYAGQRQAVVQGFAQYLHATWRVRATNGSQKYSPWSPFRVQGPAPAGIGI